MVEDARTPLGNRFWGSGLDGGGCMNDNQFMGLGIRFVGGGYTKSAKQSIRGALDSMVEDAGMTIN